MGDDQVVAEGDDLVEGQFGGGVRVQHGGLVDKVLASAQDSLGTGLGADQSLISDRPAYHDYRCMLHLCCLHLAMPLIK